MRLCILSGRHPTTSFPSPVNHQAYARTHGYTYIHCNWPTGASNAYFNKLSYIQTYYHLFDYIFWIDDDAFFLDPNRSLRFLIPPDDAFLSICRSPSHKRLKTPISSGQFLLRCSSVGRKFVDELLTVDMNDVARWWSDDLGYFSNGDQDAMVYLLHRDERYRSGCAFHEHDAFNSRLEDVRREPAGVFLLHFTGSKRRKRRDYETAKKLLGTDGSLLPPATLRALNFEPVRPTPPQRRFLQWIASLVGPHRTKRVKSLLRSLGLKRSR